MPQTTITARTVRAVFDLHAFIPYRRVELMFLVDFTHPLVDPPDTSVLSYGAVGRTAAVSGGFAVARFGEVALAVPFQNTVRVCVRTSVCVRACVTVAVKVTVLVDDSSVVPLAALNTVFVVVAVSQLVAVTILRHDEGTGVGDGDMQMGQAGHKGHDRALSAPSVGLGASGTPVVPCPG
ncbi:hypothetical protein SPBR_03248 [Sporothrix brasiliensis 5110]|uniref:Uncharacterized protein n=1 Tax=Sporothrix brasiliensis 5110 TaxID=1398154 RepID=A0A0C2J0E6_9PEZI|nr:uncharacterized protein SPBR_03248 [Sporothrix brasiliensis 5110]KIH92470.1 hypothetical protein SPBR_03248 [Sporothrix brasiliensis 5110]